MSYTEFKTKYRHHYYRAQAEIREKLVDSLTPQFIRDHRVDIHKEIALEGARCLRDYLAKA